MVSFFFQAEDGIRDHCVTGVQTCALPIYDDFLELRRPRAEPPRRRSSRKSSSPRSGARNGSRMCPSASVYSARKRSEERRVGKECRSLGWANHEKKKTDIRRKKCACIDTT